MIFDVTPITSPRPTDCGATCMQMLLKFYGQDVDLATLIKECHTGLAGCTGRDLVDCGRLHGLDMKPYKCDPADIYTSDRPLIVWWMYKHFVIFCGVDEDGKVVICNPDRGRYRVTKGTFASFYTGVCFSNGEIEDLPNEV